MTTGTTSQAGRRLSGIFRILGAIIISLSGAAVAYLLGAGAKAALMQTEGFEELVRYLRSEIDAFSMPIPAALGRCPPEILEKCGYRNASACPTSLCELLSATSEESGETRKIMARFCAELGRGYKQEQLVLCDATLDELRAHRSRLACELPAKQRLGGTLSVCGALALVILLI